MLSFWHGSRCTTGDRSNWQLSYTVFALISGRKKENPLVRSLGMVEFVSPKCPTSEGDSLVAVGGPKRAMAAMYGIWTSTYFQLIFETFWNPEIGENLVKIVHCKHLVTIFRRKRIAWWLLRCPFGWSRSLHPQWRNWALLCWIPGATSKSHGLVKTLLICWFPGHAEVMSSTWARRKKRTMSLARCRGFRDLSFSLLWLFRRWSLARANATALKMVDVFDLIVALNPSQSVKSWSKSCCNGHLQVRFLYDLVGGRYRLRTKVLEAEDL